MVGVRCVVPLNATLLACSTDLVLRSGRWSNGKARGYGGRVPVRDPFQMCVNAYRVLRTRGRDVCVVWVPPLGELDEMFDYLAASGFRQL